MAEETHDRLVQAIAAMLVDLNLAGAAGVVADVGANVYKQLVPESLNVKYPCALVTCDGLADEEGDSDFEDDVVVHPVQVLFLDAMAPNLNARRGHYQRWKHDAAMRLRGLVNPPLFATAPECFDVRLRNLPDDTGRGRSKHFQAGFVALCHCQETRQRGQA